MKMYQVDAFTKELFRGNPAAVIVEKNGRCRFNAKDST